ncbi:MAG TPA: ABC transporter ATP-binding protein [Dehalococcoidia bacterium]|jgi:ATP-binding cassette subfamily B protein
MAERALGGGAARGFWTALGVSFQADPTLFVVVFGLETAIAVMGLLGTYAVKGLTNAALAGSIRGVLVAAGGIALAGLVQRFGTQLSLNATAKVQEKAQLLLDQHLMALAGGVPGIEHHERPDYADQMALLRNERRALGQVSLAAVWNVKVAVQFVGQAVLLATLHPLLLLLPLCGVPSLLVGTRVTALVQRFHEANTERTRTIGHLFGCATSAAAGKELRVFGLAGELIARHRRLSNAGLRDQDRVEWQAVALGAAGDLCFAAGYVAAIAFVLWRAFRGLATAGDVALAATLAAQVNGNVAEAVGRVRFTQGVLRAAKRYQWLAGYGEEAVRQIRETRETQPAPVPEHLTSGISLKDITFRYPGAGEDLSVGSERVVSAAKGQAVLRDVSVHLPAGKVVALVGENGAGKTTLVKLLARLYEPTAGQILVDGVDVRRLDLDAWRGRLSTAFQDFARFELVVREAVGVGELARIEQPETVGAALGRAGAAEMVEALPERLETLLGQQWPGGIELSGGQWQRLALARGFMREDPLLVVFDEPTAAIDAPTEHALFERFAAAARSGASRGMVTLLISHRFSTVRMADLILVLDGGQIVEQGSHDELIRLGGLYAELYELQAAAYR